MAARVDIRASWTMRDLGSETSSGTLGMRWTETPRNLAICGRSADNHASTSRTAMRKHMCGAGWGSHRARPAGAQGKSSSRSTRTTHGESAQARLLRALRCPRDLLQEVASVRIVRPADVPVGVTDQLRDDVEIPDPVEEVDDLAKLAIRVDLLKVGWPSRASSARSSSRGRSRRSSPQRTTVSRVTTGVRFARWVKDSVYCQRFGSPVVPSPTLTVTTGSRLALSDRMAETPPRARTAAWSPPPTSTRSLRNRTESRRLDLPAAFGPTMKTRRANPTSTSLKFRQFLNLSRVIRSGSVSGANGVIARHYRSRAGPTS